MANACTSPGNFATPPSQLAKVALSCWAMDEKLSNPQLRKLKALAQQLEPMLRVGKAGLSESFLKSVDEALLQRELVKIKFAVFKEDKKALAPLLAEKTGSCLVMRVGNVAVLYRANPDPGQRRIQW
jgi:RNA-binding protein